MKNLVFLVLGVALLGGLFVWLKPAEAPSPATHAGVTTPQAEHSEPAPAVLPVFDLEVRDGRLVSGPEVIKLRQGDEIIISITTDSDDEFHLHGYNRKLELKAGQPQSLQLRADLAGRFGYELHHSDTELGALEVQPR